MLVLSPCLRRPGFQHVFEIFYFSYLAEAARCSRIALPKTPRIVLPKMPRRFFGVKVILFSVLALQMIEHAALPNLRRQRRVSLRHIPTTETLL
jgi:hypothetical protein